MSIRPFRDIKRKKTKEIFVGKVKLVEIIPFQFNQ
tara:strand:- start:185 stop:289 length:105 start_codon:yes stop_codon:yes gene_type:complete